MANNKIHFDWPRTGDDLYLTVEKSDDTIWEVVGAAFETRVVANWSNSPTAEYVVSMSESPASSYHYVGTFPSSIAAGTYLVRIRLAVAGASSEAVSDPVIGCVSVKWDGAAIDDGLTSAAMATMSLYWGNVETGTAQAGASTTITLAAGESAVPEFYTKAVIFLTGGTGVGQYRKITAYDETTKVATIDTDWATTPDSTTTYLITGRIT